MHNCVVYKGDSAAYQQQAHQALYDVSGTALVPYAWIDPNCQTAQCLNPEHMDVHAPMHLEYPRGVCVYCGDPGWTRDHILPRPWTGDTIRRSVITIPACQQCNSMIGAALTWSISERRALAHSRIERKYRKILRLEDRTRAEKDEFGPAIRSSIDRGELLKRHVFSRLSWPHDPAYDLRAMELSGIEDPYAAGLLTRDVYSSALRAWL